MSNRWPFVIVTVLLLFMIGVCLKRFDFLFINEVKAIISVIFGFITSCLLLSFIWLIQKKPNTIASSESNELPSMHPGGRLEESYSLVESSEQSNIYTVSSAPMDKPPNYEEALIHSKPVACLEKQPDTSINIDDQQRFSNCNYLLLPMLSEQDSDHPVSFKRRRQTTAGQTNLNSSTATSGSSVAQLALNLVRNFGAIEPSSLHHQVVCGRRRVSHDLNASRQPNSTNNLNNNPENSRKVSYCQLDVSQLVLSQSPPKYYELTFNGLEDESLGINCNEARTSNTVQNER